MFLYSASNLKLERMNRFCHWPMGLDQLKQWNIRDRDSPNKEYDCYKCVGVCWKWANIVVASLAIIISGWLFIHWWPLTLFDSVTAAFIISTRTFEAVLPTVVHFRIDCLFDQIKKKKQKTNITNASTWRIGTWCKAHRHIVCAAQKAVPFDITHKFSNLSTTSNAVFFCIVISIILTVCGQTLFFTNSHHHAENKIWRRQNILSEFNAHVR